MYDTNIKLSMSHKVLRLCVQALNFNWCNILCQREHNNIVIYDNDDSHESSLLPSESKEIKVCYVNTCMDDNMNMK